ncbi:hypothetical protein [Cochleicola gelatinilyticus]|uniref:Uncharacterized protein n=1 Tax=Cochleicola gelatinilyticus TaxID=1763537 RepID=A0A167KB77_9FLAO|nr:hypothetical protein [Cochleicola gelatinilyticus]OAB81683.1 hypothetical protein ULVI_00905 [Cochleicola gelatinilyticus]
MKKIFHILLVLIATVIVGFVGLTIFGISIMGKEMDTGFGKKPKQSFAISKQKRVFYVYGLDTINWQELVLKQKIEIMLQKTERDSTIFFSYTGLKDSLDNYGSLQFVKYEKAIYILGERHNLIGAEKYINKEISKFPFDLYETIEFGSHPNGPFLFNSDYGLLKMDVMSDAKQLFYLPTGIKINLENELLRK